MLSHLINICFHMNLILLIQASVYTVPVQRFSYSNVWWHPYYSLKEYRSFQDAKIYVLNVPEYTKQMRLTFIYQGVYVPSHKACNNTISVLVQQGRPAIPYQDEIHADGWLYNNTNHYKTTVSLGQNKDKNISSPFPGKWYVTAFLPYMEKVKKITEKGLSKADEKCLSALIVNQILVSPRQPPVVLAKGQPWKASAKMGSPILTYYKYFVSAYSKQLHVQLKTICDFLNNCSLKLSLSSNSLPTNSSQSCMAPCELHVSWAQPHSVYYIEVSGTSESYEITANHTECHPRISGCTKIVNMALLHRKRLSSSWGLYFFNGTRTFSLTIGPDFVGTTLMFMLWPYFPSTFARYTMCITKDVLPPFNVSKSEESSRKFCTEKSGGVLRMTVVFPQAGTWYIAVSIQIPFSYSPIFVFHAKTQPCLSTCIKHGSCVIKSDIGISYGSCTCDYGYSGFTCSDYHSLDVLAVCLLTISNIAFIPGIVIACSRKFFPEAIVYLFNMYCSTMYHACDSHGFCVYDFNTLQLSDFLASVFSVWVTLITMVKLPTLWHQTLNILAVLSLFIGVQLSRFGLLIIAIPGGTGLVIVLISFGFRCYKRGKFYPSYKRWLLFILPALTLAAVAVGIYAGLETTANYKYLHSIWHIAIALCIPLLLPSVRKTRLYVNYNLVGQQNDDESYGESDESLLLNVRNTADNNDGGDEPESEEVTFPRLVST